MLEGASIRVFFADFRLVLNVEYSYLLCRYLGGFCGYIDHLNCVYD